jgi:hypothetical protein
VVAPQLESHRGRSGRQNLSLPAAFFRKPFLPGSTATFHGKPFAPRIRVGLSLAHMLFGGQREGQRGVAFEFASAASRINTNHRFLQHILVPLMAMQSQR